MRTRIMIVMTLAILAAAACQPAATPRAEGERQARIAQADMVVYKSPTCGCCDAWIEHARDAGFSVAAVDLVAYDAITGVKAEQGIPLDLASCHTTVVGGYAVEGHVPAHVIRRLLDEQPALRGLAVPGMPAGSPGMEGPNARPYDVIAIGLDGSRHVYQTVDPGMAGGR
jgi:hypothetical protein